ncbi:hypothetical protein FM114_01890 [Luteococcus japonicus LSP_Lj1]|uniref:Uncharacterized protein n=1 Tax=Luteococcus japonicus LSP_Lj1 TaxID=1255658 RepID=A0A1R4IHG6_9ACTN|nr:hypothetical protein FM114_01890 [Luteococcus japonicus LSP_Lj1]
MGVRDYLTSLTAGLARHTRRGAPAPEKLKVRGSSTVLFASSGRE